MATTKTYSTHSAISWQAAALAVGNTHGAAQVRLYASGPTKRAVQDYLDSLGLYAPSDVLRTLRVDPGTRTARDLAAAGHLEGVSVVIAHNSKPMFARVTAEGFESLEVPQS